MIALPDGRVLVKSGGASSRRSWLAVQNPHDVLGRGDCRDSERKGKNQLFEGGHAENGSMAGSLDR
jgi:hypothetical protein